MHTEKCKDHSGLSAGLPWVRLKGHEEFQKKHNAMHLTGQQEALLTHLILGIAIVVNDL